MKAENEKILMQLLDGPLDPNKRAELIDQLKGDDDALQVYQLMSEADDYIGQLETHDPPPNFNEGVLYGFRRIKTREKNNRLLSYFLGVVVAAIALVLSLAGDASTALPTESTPLVDRLNQWIPTISLDIHMDQLVQFVLVLNGILLIVVIEKIISRKRLQGFYSF